MRNIDALKASTAATSERWFWRPRTSCAARLPGEETLGAHDVRIAIHTVGICGSDVHYYTHGAIGPFVVREPMILGHEAPAS